MPVFRVRKGVEVSDPLKEAVDKSGKAAEKIVEATATVVLTPLRVVEKTVKSVDRGLRRLLGMDW